MYFSKKNIKVATLFDKKNKKKNIIIIKFNYYEQFANFAGTALSHRPISICYMG
jgi:hypothetical protein